MHAGKPPEQKKDEVKDSSSENNQSQGGENKEKIAMRPQPLRSALNFAAINTVDDHVQKYA